MNKIRPNDTRYEIIKKFDDCMDEFFARTIGFCEEITRIAESDESNMKINTLALNLLEDLNLITQNAEFYENVSGFKPAEAYSGGGDSHWLLHTSYV